MLRKVFDLERPRPARACAAISFISQSFRWRSNLKKSYIYIIVICVIFLDQITKIYINSNILIHDSFSVIGGLFNITHIRNTGAAFGFLAKVSPMFRFIFLIAVTVAAILLIIYYFWKTGGERMLLNISLSLILGGAVGNLIDRVRLGEVIDFLDFYIGAYHWPAFNVADSAISAGAIILIFEVLKRRSKEDMQ